jgi:alkyl hydroperoxide reductase subunit AhpC
MIQVGQKVDDFEFEMYHNQDISKAKFSSFSDKWLVFAR